ncbi:MAG: response regulator [Kofleriaceae bacterium]|nr:response regulator [Kofleriaceae bacterium]
MPSEVNFPPLDAPAIGAASPNPPILASGRTILAAVFQLVTDSVLVWNATGTVVECSPAAERLLGYGAGSLTGARVDTVLYDIVEGRALLRCSNGEQLECSIELLPASNGGSEYIIAVLRPTLGVQSGLHTVRGLSRQVVERVADVVFQLDSQGMWVFANQVWTTLTGRTVAETLRHSVYASVDPEDHPLLRECIAGLLEGTQADARVSVRVLTATQNVKWVELALRRVVVAGRVEGVAGTMADITDKREAEAELRTVAQRAATALSTKDMFLANMSHEIRTPMNAVIALTGLLLETTLSDEQRDFIDTIRASGDALLTLINEILDFSKVESDHFVLEETDYDVREVLEGAMELVATSPKASQIELMMRIGASVPGVVVGDPTRVRQILVNLAANAMKFTARGHVMVSVDVRRLDGRSWLRFEVIDTGIGIPPERADRLFRPFTQVDASTTRQYGGTGLGLAICRQLVLRMGGSIDFTSKANEGSVFFFEVPLVVAASDAVASAVTQRQVLTGHTVRVVHPYGPSNDHVGRLLARAGARLGPHGIEAQIVDESAPDLESLLSRAMVPSVVMVTKARRAIWQPVVDRAKQAGNSITVISKPVRGPQLINAVSALFADTIRMDAAAEISGVITLPVEKIAVRVLVAEDNVVNQKVAIALLGKFGYKPDVVSNGLEALMALERKQYDIVFLDVQMPEMDGLEAARCIVTTFEQARRPVLIAMTANVTPLDRAQCFAAGCELYVAKPVKVSELELALTAAHQRLAGRRAVVSAPTVGTAANDATALTAGSAPTSCLRDLVTETSQALVVQIVQHFVDDAAPRLRDLERAADTALIADAGRAAHALRSAALNVGLNELAAACQDIERTARLGADPLLRGRVAKVREQLATDVTMLKCYIAAVGAAT